MNNKMPTIEKTQKSKSRKKFGLIFGALLIVAAGLTLIWQFTSNQGFDFISDKISRKNSDELNTELFWQVYDLLDKNYLDADKLSKEKLMYGAISGMVAATGDPYTSFFTPEQNGDFKDSLEGVYGGIGAQLGFKDQRLVIVTPLEGSPAERAGVKPGEGVLAVNDESTAGWSLAEAVDKIRGEIGTTVKLTLDSGDVEMVREEIKIPAVRLTWEDGQIAHLRVIRFGSDTIDEWSKKVDEVVKSEARGVVLDVRNNPGGFLNAAIYLGSEFFPNGIVVKKQSRNSTLDYKVDHKCRLCEVPMVVLINEGSASASEILAGALQKRGRAELVGKTSFGKGTVQEAIELSEGASVHITTARWLLPNDENITESGLTPEHEVEATAAVGPYNSTNEDSQLQAALEILREKLPE
jgi:carboxyl-terminal processing protease